MVGGSASAERPALHDLLERAQNGDGRAFGELYRRLSGRVLGLCRHLLGSREDAEDAAAEVFLRFGASLPQLDRSVPPAAWLAKVATNHCVDRLRRRSREFRLFAGPTDEGEAGRSEALSPLAELIAQEERSALAAALAALPDRYRVPLVLRYYAELSYDEIAERLGLSRQEVATSLFRAKQRLRGALARPVGSA
jgi:RNA polymerase sigma-70 factor (ECF subfamily)